MEILFKPWAWYIAGPAIALIMFLLLYFGGNFGMSANLRTMCTIAGGDRYTDFFKINWKAQRWNLVFVVGAILGGFIAIHLLSDGSSVELNPKTVIALEALGFQTVGQDYLPNEIFGLNAIYSFKGLGLLIVAGFLVGFGARYAGGCTSGHAISGLSDLQIPSLIAVVGFFIGGLLMTHLFLPIIF